MAQLVFYHGSMSSGKSTLALQALHNRTLEGRRGLALAKFDRAGSGVLSSRLGIQAPACEVTDDTNLYDLAAAHKPLDLIVADEVQFYLPRQIEQLADVVDQLDISVYAFGLKTNFRSELFPGSKRLLELADEIVEIQSHAVCWCGQRASMNARLIGGQLVTTGDEVVVGDTDDSPVRYRVLCRKHYRLGQVEP